MHQHLEAASKRLAVSIAGLQAISPLATLQRGYAVVSDAKTGAIIGNASTMNKGDRIDVRLARGKLHAIVKKTRSD